MGRTIERYGRRFKDLPDGNREDDDLRIEMDCIQYKIGDPCEHYENMRRIIWPRLQTHRWHDLCMSEIPKNKVTVLMGPKSTGKTHEMACYGICKYFVSPHDTCVMVSSTDIRGLKLRVWGEITMLWNEAVQRFDWLPGHYLESRLAITTDALDDGDFDQRTVRDMRKGIIGIPCVMGNRFVGLGKYCFPDGTMVDCDTGSRPIESIHEGDRVWSVAGLKRVIATSDRYAQELARIHFTDGTHIDCTPNHQFFCSTGWINAIDIPSQTVLYSTHEAMRCLRSGTSKTRKEVLLSELSENQLEEALPVVQEGVHSIGRKGSLLHPSMRLRVEMEPAGISGEDECCGREKERSEYFRSYHGESVRKEKTLRADDQDRQGNSQKKESSWIRRLVRIWRKPQSNSKRACDDGTVSICEAQLCSCHREVIQTWEHSDLLDRPCVAGNQTCCGNRRLLSRVEGTAGTRCQEGFVSESKRVDRVEILSRTGDARYDQNKGGYRVRNLQVEGHPSYSVNGLLVHNCGIKQKHVLLLADELALMGSSFLGSFSNLDGNEDFQAVCAFNPIDPLDQGGRAAEPKEGWSKYMSPEKTAVWDTLFMNGRCINLIGTDTPNNDYPNEKAHFKFLLAKHQIESTKQAFGEESIEYYSQCKGWMKIAQLSFRVLNRELCEKGGAFDDVVWEGSPRVHVAALDSAWGGDRCVFTHAEFGKEVGGKTVLKLYPPEIIPFNPTPGQEADYAIAEWVKQRCEELDIPPANFGHDSTGRGSLGTALARVWSAECNPVEFGGQPTQRPVTGDYYFTDPRTSDRRLKLCSEHYNKFVTELWFSVRYCVEAKQLRNLSPEVFEEFALRIWRRVKDDKIEVESKSGTQEKPGMKQRTGKSPDLADATSIVVEMARRRGFTISKLENEDVVVTKNRWIQEMAEQHRSFLRKGQLIEV